MVEITAADVAAALHTTEAELPDGYEHDIQSAETIVGTQVEPYVGSNLQDAVDLTAVYVACAFITGSENDTTVSRLQRESATIQFDADASSDEASDYWTRAVATDPSNRLGRPTADFEVF